MQFAAWDLHAVRPAATIVAALILVAACGGTTATAVVTVPPPAATPAGSAAVASSGPISSTTGGAPPSPAAGGTVPASCPALKSTVTPFTGAIADTKSLGTPGHLSCEFLYGSGKGVLIVTIGAGGTASSFATLKAGTATGGRTVAAVAGLGADAFSVSKGGVTAGVTSLGSTGILYVIESTLTEDQDEALIRQLMAM